MKNIVIPCSLADWITASSLTEPPGSLTFSTPLRAALSMLSRNGKNASLARDTPFTLFRYSLFSSRVNGSGFSRKYSFHASMTSISGSSERYCSIALSLSFLESFSLKGRESTLSLCLRCQRSALPPASLVQCILDCCPAPTPIVWPLFA